MTGEGAMNAAAVLLGDLGTAVLSAEEKMRLAGMWMQWAMQSETFELRREAFDARHAVPWAFPQMPVAAAKSQEESND